MTDEKPSEIEEKLVDETLLDLVLRLPPEQRRKLSEELATRYPDIAKQAGGRPRLPYSEEKIDWTDREVYGRLY